MSVPAWRNGVPRKILLASDLSPRTDRALERTLLLREQWQAELVVVHTLEDPRPGPTPGEWDRQRRWNPEAEIDAASRRIRRYLGAAAEHAVLVVTTEDVADAVLDASEKYGCDLIVVGIASYGLPGNFKPGRSVEKLMRQASVPILLVRNRVFGRYENIVVASDFSPRSAGALEAAAHIFPTQTLTVFHAFDSPMVGLSVDTDAYRQGHRKMAEADWGAFVAGVTKPSANWPEPRAMIEEGAPEQTLSEYARVTDADLVVMGTHGRGAVAESFLGSTAKTIMQWLDCDAMVVRDAQLD